METHAEDDSNITTEEPDESSSENSSEEEIDPWAHRSTTQLPMFGLSTMSVLLMEGYDESKAKQEVWPLKNSTCIA